MGRLKRSPIKLEIVRCDRCGAKFYAAPNGIIPGDRCGAPIIAEWHGSAGFLMTECWGTFEHFGHFSA